MVIQKVLLTMFGRKKAYEAANSGRLIHLRRVVKALMDDDAKAATAIGAYVGAEVGVKVITDLGERFFPLRIAPFECYRNVGFPTLKAISAACAELFPQTK